METTTEKVVYSSRMLQQRFVITSPRPIFDPTKTAIVGYHQGKEIQFERGRYATNDPDEIAFLDYAVGKGSTDLMRLTSDEAGQPVPAGGVAVVATAGTGRLPVVTKEYRCAVCGVAKFTGANAVLEYGRHMREHKVAEKRAAKAAKTDATAPAVAG